MRFKVCSCCNSQAGMRKCVCPICKVPAIWREPTADELAAREADRDRLETLLQSFLRKTV